MAPSRDGAAEYARSVPGMRPPSEGYAQTPSTIDISPNDLVEWNFGGSIITSCNESLPMDASAGAHPSLSLDFPRAVDALDFLQEWPPDDFISGLFHTPAADSFVPEEPQFLNPKSNDEEAFSTPATQIHPRPSQSTGLMLSSRPRASVPPVGPKPVLPVLVPKPVSRTGPGPQLLQSRSNPLQLADLKPKSKRKKYNRQARAETAAARETGICIRCRVSRERCVRDPEDPSGPCLACKLSKPRKPHMSRLPCLRYKITDSILHRTGLEYLSFYRMHPMTVAQSVISTVREFKPPVEPDALDLKGRPMYHIRFAIADPDQATDAVNLFLDQSIGLYIDALIDDTDDITFSVFHMALRLSMFFEPDTLLRDVLRIWVACRLIESRWRCCGEYNLGAEELKDPYRPEDWISPPPYIDYQLGSIIMHRILAPLRASVLKRLHNVVHSSDKMRNWFRVFLTVFILLHNYELGVSFQQAFAARRKSPVVYLDMPLIRGIHSGAKTILAHFHTACKGNVPFSENVDYNAPAFRRMAQLDKEQIAFLRGLKQKVQVQSTYMRTINRTELYGAKFWFISQLFEENWEPRETLEHSLAASA